jgi:capsule synthesis protein PGA_cap
MMRIFRLVLLVLFILALYSSSIFAVDLISNDTVYFSLAFDEIMEQKAVSYSRSPFEFLQEDDIASIVSVSVVMVPVSIDLVFVGDIMPGTNYPNSSYLPRSCKNLFAPAYDLINGADIALANLEGVFSSNGGVAKNCHDPKTCYVFRMPDAYADCIKETGFDILGVANNHVNDFGPEGRKNTARLLKEKGFYFAGFSSYPYTIFECGKLKIGYCAFAPHTGTVNLKDYVYAKNLVSMLDSLCDIVVVNFHGGAEGSDHQHITKEDEMYLGYNRGNVYRFAHTVIDAGADVVVGHGPHVVRAIEFYKGKLIAYSLGNFCTYARFNLTGPNAYAPALELNLSGSGEFISAKIHSFYQDGEGGPVVDPLQRAARRILELSRADFPEQDIFIDDEGWIIHKSQ